MPDLTTLPRDRRGYIIPWAVYRDSHGEPQFTINDHRKRAFVLKRDLCPICGTKLLRGRWFVGGPQSAFHDQGCYIDPPMHRECAIYSLECCPYLASPRYSKRIDAIKLPHDDPARLLIIDPQSVDPVRPVYFVAALATGQKIIADGL
jgi:hypothetical protein